MDAPYELSLPDPPATPQVVPARPDLVNAFGDPLCQMLGWLEASIEQPVSISNMYADPLCKTLDELEASVEQRIPIIDHSKPLHEMLSQLENEIEQQRPVPTSRKDFPKDLPQPEQYSLPMLLDRKPLPTSPSTQKTEMAHKESFSLWRHAEPVHRMTGHYTGIRNSGNGFDWYCNIRQEWVSRDECEDCPDFEEAEYATGNEEDERCRHSFSTDLEERDKTADENVDSEDQTDE